MLAGVGLLSTLFLSGCATTPSHVVVHDSMVDQQILSASEDIQRQVQRIAASNDAVPFDRYKGFPVPKPSPEINSTPSGSFPRAGIRDESNQDRSKYSLAMLNKEVRVQWNGVAPTVVSQLATYAGWTYGGQFDKDSHPVDSNACPVVNIPLSQGTVMGALKDIGNQMGTKADVNLNPYTRVISIKTHETGTQSALTPKKETRKLSGISSADTFFGGN